MFNPDWFEGTEKKIELTVDPGFPSLRKLGEPFWRNVVARAGAGVLSHVTGHGCDAYLLSESSLFVFDRRMVMITCGQTRLTDAVPALLERIPDDRMEMFVYERKNEIFPHRQPTSFFDDVEALGASLPGRAFRFGDEDEHHLYVFYLDRPVPSYVPDWTVEILMYELSPEACDRFRGSGGDPRAARERTGLQGVLPGFEIDDHWFEPEGYSMNAIGERGYMTLHVTLRDTGSYASFESNCRDRETLERASRGVLELFRPRSFDSIVWERGNALPTLDPGYRVKTRVVEELSCGYRVHFVNHYLPREFGRAVELTPNDRSRGCA